jgi:Mg2+/citrate symporter
VPFTSIFDKAEQLVVFTNSTISSTASSTLLIHSTGEFAFVSDDHEYTRIFGEESEIQASTEQRGQDKDRSTFFVFTFNVRIEKTTTIIIIEVPFRFVVEFHIHFTVIFNQVDDRIKNIIIRENQAVFMNFVVFGKD